METFKCAMCSGEFKKARSDDEALQEMRGNFGDVAPEDCAIICDDCYQTVHPSAHPTIVAEYLSAEQILEIAKLMKEHGLLDNDA